MHTLNHTLFISDLHLQEQQPHTTTNFFNFLEHHAPLADALYILGDFFDSWIGDDNLTSFNRDICCALHKTANNGLPIYFMHGNRDFLIGKKFCKTSGVKLINDPCIITPYHKPILLTHGDALCTLDVTHQKYRAKVNNPYVQNTFLMLPLWIRRKIAQRARRKSQGHINPNHEGSIITDVTPAEVERLMQKNNLDLMIHGHTHRPAIHNITLDGKAAQRIVLGAWYQKASFLQYFSDNTFKLHAVDLA